MEVMMMSSCRHEKTSLSPSSAVQIPSCLSPPALYNKNSSCSTPTASTTAVPVPVPVPAQQGGVVVMSPCAACKILRRRCSAEKCVLAPYFPPTDPIKFATAHKVFGASNIIKLLQELPENERADAVSSMVYEANARVRDPVYGSAGAICNLQKQVGLLQAELARSQAELLTLKSHQSHLLAMLCINVNPNNNTSPIHTSTSTDHYITNKVNSLPPSPVNDQDYSSELLDFYPDATNCTLFSWELL